MSCLKVSEPVFSLKGVRRFTDMSSPDDCLMHVWRLIDANGNTQKFSSEDSMKIETTYRDNPAKPVTLGSLTINLKNKTAFDATSKNCSRLDRECGEWSVFWNGQWRQLPWELSHRISEAIHHNPTRVFQEKDLFHKRGTYRFILLKRQVIDMTAKATVAMKLAEKELFDDFTADFETLVAQGAAQVDVAVGEVRALLAGFPGFVFNFGNLPPDSVLFTKYYAAVGRYDMMSRGNSYSDRMYGWVWDQFMKPKPVVPGVHLDYFDDPAATGKINLLNVIFIDNPSLMQRFTAAVEKTGGVPNWPPCAAASKLNSLCSEREFLFSHPRVALMMHVPNEKTDRVILSCGFSMKLNAESTIVGNGIAFTSNPEFAKEILSLRFKNEPRPAARAENAGAEPPAAAEHGGAEPAAAAEPANAEDAGANPAGVKPARAVFYKRPTKSIIFSWVAIGNPYFAQQQVTDRQPGCTTHFALTHNGGFAVLNGAVLDTPILVSFEPELCCPFAVAEFEYLE